MSDKIPNQHELIPNLGVLDRLLMESSIDGSYSAIQRETEQLPYYLRGACFSINELEFYRNRAAKALSELPGASPTAQFVLPPEHSDPLSFATDSYLFFLRRVMDAVISYLGRCPNRISLPSSMNTLMKGIETGKYKLDSQIKTILEEYWNSVGVKIKGYRDQVNHKAIILSNCVAFNGTGGIGLKMLLPDNPEEDRPSKINYEPGINAMGFLLESLKETIKFINALVEKMIDLMAKDGSNPREKGIVGITMRGTPVSFGSSITGEPVPFPVGVKEIVKMAFE